MKILGIRATRHSRFTTTQTMHIEFRLNSLIKIPYGAFSISATSELNINRNTNFMVALARKFLKSIGVSEHTSLRLLYYKFVIENLGLYCLCFQSSSPKEHLCQGLDPEPYYSLYGVRSQTVLFPSGVKS